MTIEINNLNLLSKDKRQWNQLPKQPIWNHQVIQLFLLQILIWTTNNSKTARHLC